MLEQASSLAPDIFAKLLMIIWSLWRNRNDKLWKNTEKPAPLLVAMRMAWYENFFQANKTVFVSSGHNSKAKRFWKARVAG